jgi:hypothetical protein
MPMWPLAAHPCTLSGPIVAVFYNHAVYYEAAPSVNRSSIKVAL